MIIYLNIITALPPLNHFARSHDFITIHISCGLTCDQWNQAQQW